MDARERDELMQMLQSLAQVRLRDKDFVAESLILEACARQPDALYLLAQRVMALQAALAATQARIAQQGAVQASDPALALPPAAEGAWRRGLVAQGATLAVGAAAGAMAGAAVAMMVGAAGATTWGDSIADGASDLLDGLTPSDWV